MRAHSVVSSKFFGALVAVPVVALVASACSTAVRGSGFDTPDENADASAAQTGDGTSSGSPSDPGQTIAKGDAGPPAPPVPPGSQIDLTKVTPCDQNLDVGGDMQAFLKAIGLCQMADANGTDWGVIEAKFTNDLDSDSENQHDGQHGILPKFGDVLTPREGSSLGVLSTGWAREFDSENGSSESFQTTSKKWQSGSGGDLGFGGERNDVIVAHLKIRVPTNAKSFSFDFNFHSSEWPSFIGSSYNDEFRANLNGTNISFDADQHPVSVNLGFFDRCVPDVTVGCDGEQGESQSVCSGGPGELSGTGFGLMNGGCSGGFGGFGGGGGGQVTEGGATGWLTTTASVTPGDVITLEFAVWDASDQALDSLVLLDNFKWDADPATTQTVRPPN